MALLVGIELYNYERVKSMEAILDKTLKTIHRRTGMTDRDVQKLRKVYPDFNWENTWDRERWLAGKEGIRKRKIQQGKDAKRALRLMRRKDMAR